jgi:hypothetical protein
VSRAAGPRPRVAAAAAAAVIAVALMIAGALVIAVAPGRAVASPRATPPQAPPQNPFLAPNPFSNLHDDTWMSNVYPTIAGPTAGASVAYGSYAPSICGSLLFDARGRIVSVCPGAAATQARIIDPATLRVVGTYDLPGGGATGFQSFTGGGYIYLDQHNRLWTTTRNRHLYELAIGAHGFRRIADYDLSTVLATSDGITSALPDFQGDIWFVTRPGGVVGVIPHGTHRVRVTRADSEIENSFAVGRDGIYIVSEHSIYRYGLGRGDRPVVTWRATYPNSHIHKPGQVDAGSGTTPAILSGGYTAITDNADPMDVVVYRTAARLRHRQRRLVCRVPVFHAGAGDTENSLIADGRSLIVENNYGYAGYAGPDANAQTTPGFARVDIARDGHGCHRVWQTDSLAAPSVVPKLSLKTGLIYTYVRKPGATAQWAWAALSLRTGRTAFSIRTGTGTLYNNNYASISLGPTGNAYLATIGGITELRRR